MRKGKLAVVTLFAVALLALPVYADSAQTTSTPKMQDEATIPIAPFWDNVAFASTNLTFDNGRGTLTGSVIGIPGASITVNATLDRVNTDGTTTHIASFSNLQGTGNVWTWERVHYVARGHDYRLTLEITAVRNGISETITVSSTRRAS